MDAVFAWRTTENHDGVTDLTLRYTQCGRYGKGNSYVFVDCSANYKDTYQTFEPSRFMWGKRAYSLGGAQVINPDTGLDIE